MNRRRLITGTISTVPILAGCLSTVQDGSSGGDDGCTGDWNPTVDADEPRLSPGEDATLRVAVTNIMGLALLIPIHDDDDGLEFGDETIVPPPDRHADSSPPQWFWEECTDVEVEVPIRVQQDAHQARIQYTAHIVQSLDGSGESTDREYTITITND